jgi:glycosyltransferase involved in cell wall biosynthesis
MSLNKHIVWISPGFASSEADDSCIPTLLDLLAQIKAEKKMTVSIIALQYPFSSQPYELLGAKVYPLNGRNKWYNKITVWKKALQTLEQIHKIHPVNLVHSFWLGDAALIGQAFSVQQKIEHICTCMGQDVLKDNRHLNNRRLADVPLIAISEFQAETYYRNTGKRVKEVIPFGMPAQATEPAKKEYDIIGVGSLIPVKNYEMWIEIIEQVKEKIPAVKALLVGSGEQEKDLAALIDKKKLHATVTLAGNKSRAETLQLMGSSKLFLHTAKFEGQGYVFMEAMSRHLGILSTPVGYAIENEKIWKGTSPETFAQEIAHLLRLPDQRVNYTYPDTKETLARYRTYYKD